MARKCVKIFNNCGVQCRFKCKDNFSLIEQGNNYRASYYGLDQKAKSYFLLNHTDRVPVKRKKSLESTYRSYSFEYYLTKNEQKIRVCKSFF